MEQLTDFLVCSSTEPKRTTLTSMNKKNHPARLAKEGNQLNKVETRLEDNAFRNIVNM